jgi:hypothetical protein
MATVNVNVPKNVNHDGEDNVYYNIRITNEEDTAKHAVYSANRTVPILEIPADYEMAVMRFSVPALFIPIFLWETPTPLSVSMRYDGEDITEDLQFIQRADNPNNPPYGEAVWNYQELVDMINVALKTAWDAMKVAKPASPTTEAPFMVYDAKTELCSLYAEKLFDSSTNTIEILFSKRLFVLFPSFQSYVSTVAVPPPELTRYQILVKDNKTNSTTYNAKDYFIMEQEYPTLALWNGFSTIVFETDSIPVEPEFLATQNNTTRRLLTDFEPLSTINDRQVFQYFPQGKVRYYDMKSNYPMKRIDLRVYWEDNLGKVYPLYLGQGDVLTMKLLFRKKSALQLEQSIFATEDDM